MAEAMVQLVSDLSLLTFEDVYINFTPEEWLLLDEGQRLLYSYIMMENFMVASSVGLDICGHGTMSLPGPVRQPSVVHDAGISLAETQMTPGSSGPGCGNRVNDENASSERDVSVGVSQVGTLQVGPSIQKSHQCDMCDPVLKDILHLAGQQGASPGQKTYQCKSCGRAFWFSVNPDQISRQQSGETSGRMETSQTLSAPSGRSHVLEVAFTGRRSGDDFSASSGLVQYCDTHNVEEPPQSIEQREYSCSKCGKSFSNHSFFVLHQKSHNQVTFYQCIDCGKLFRSSSSLEEHLKIHMLILKLYVCTECGKAFHKKFHLTQHRKVHTEAKHFVCHVCKKAFSSKKSLTQHQEIHIGEKPYSCNRCDKAFYRKYVLTDHQRIHTAEKFHECNECGKFFTSSFSLKVHKRIHSGTRPYVCSECGKSYTVNSHLSRHKKVHTKSRPRGEENVENSLVEAPTSLCTRDETLEQGLICSPKVGEPTEGAPTLCG